MKKYFSLLFITFSLTLTLFVDAKPRGAKRVYKVEFEDELVVGGVKRPDIFHLFKKQKLEYSKVIELKKNFLPEMRRTAGEID